MNENEARPGDQEPASEDAPGTRNGGPLLQLAPEDYPDVSHLITEDGAPVESMYVEKQYKLLTDALESSWKGPGDGCPFVAMTNVGLFVVPRNPALVPDFLLSLEVRYPEPFDPAKKEHQSYFVWEFGKPPDVIVEIVSDRLGGEETHKLRAYARLPVPYYVIYDRKDLLGGGVLRVMELRGRHYTPVPDNWLNDIELGLRLWQGEYGGYKSRWLRWCDKEGNLIPAGRERAEQEKQRTEQEKQRAEQEKQRAEQEKQRAEQEKQRAEEQAERARRLEAQLRAAGIEPQA